MRVALTLLFIACLAGCGERPLPEGRSLAEVQRTGVLLPDDVLLVAPISSTRDGARQTRILASHVGFVRDPNWSPPEGWSLQALEGSVPAGWNPFPPTTARARGLGRYASCLALDYEVSPERIRASELAAYAAKHGAQVIDLITLREVLSEEVLASLPLDPTVTPGPVPREELRGPFRHEAPNRRYRLK